ncbi:MAG: CPBP family intramembrane glutamic endopeptidase [Petrimonas sp.]|nr:CPBP family intramembrane glutamic endopeptidase [Petrimonas sp.]
MYEADFVEDSMERKRKELQWWDVIIVSLILFSGPIWSSTVTFFTVSSDILAQRTEFTSADNWFAMLSTSLELLIAYFYLRWRQFDFKQWYYKLTLRGTAAAVGIFVIISLAMDMVTILSIGWKETTAYIGGGAFFYVLEEIDLSLILFSLLNGFYEEIFFLGVCMVVPERQKVGVLCYSLLIRFSFHTYQGLPAALGIGFVLGGIYYFLYQKSDKNLYPYMLSHSFADIIGTGILPLL